MLLKFTTHLRARRAACRSRATGAPRGAHVPEGGWLTRGLKLQKVADHLFGKDVLMMGTTMGVRSKTLSLQYNMIGICM